jgi:hypothetical protein
MAKHPSTPPTDLNAVMSFVANRTVEPEPAAKPEPAEPAAAPAPSEPTQVVAESQPKGKKTTPEVAPASADGQAYAEAFLKPVRERKTKAIYVTEELHGALSVLTQDAGVGLADLLINITSHHFEMYKPAIRQYLADQEKLKKKKLPF